jgi:hypothetical protein
LHAVLCAALSSFARFEHRGVVVTYSGLVLDQTAIVAAIDAAAAGLKGVDAGPVLLRLRVVVDADAAAGAMVATWSRGSRPMGRVRVAAGPGFSEAIRAGIDALLHSHFDPAWRPTSTEGPVI